MGLLAIEIALAFDPSIDIIATVGSPFKVKAIEEKTGLPSHQVIVRKGANQFKAQCKHILSELQDMKQEKISLFNTHKENETPSTKEEEEEEDDSKHQKPLPKDVGFDLVMESLGGEYFSTTYHHLLNRNGRMITFGASRYMTPTTTPSIFHLAYHYLWTRSKIDTEEMISENKSIMGFNLIWFCVYVYTLLYHYCYCYLNMYIRCKYNRLTDKLDELNKEVDDLFDLKDWSSSPPHVGATFAFNQLDEAVRFLQSGQSVGKVVVVV